MWIQFIEGEASVALILACVTMTLFIIWMNRHS